MIIICQFNFAQIAGVGAFTGKNLNQTDNNRRRAELKSEITALKQTALKKIDDDVESISNGFSNSEAILRRLRVAYGFKTALDLVSSTFGVISSFKNVGNLKDGFKKAKSPLEWASLGLALNGAVENGQNLAFVFDGNRHSENVKQMLDDADATQPVLKFDSVRYQNSIKESLNNNNIAVVPHRNSSEICQTVKPRGEKFSPSTPFKNLTELRRYISSELNALESKINAKSFTPAQTEQIIILIKNTKRALIESKLRTNTVELTAPKILVKQNCQPTTTKVSLGKIASKQTILAAAYEALDKKLLFEQVLTIKTGIDGATSATQVFLAGKNGNSPKNKILDEYSNLSLGFDAGVWTAQQVFPSLSPDKLIADIPQEMILALPEEESNVALLIDTLKKIIEQSAGQTILILPTSAAKEIPTLFLLDVSGSMNENDKIGQAKISSLNALGEIQENKRLGCGDAAVSVWTFSGDCSPNSARRILPFTNNLTQAETTLRTKIPRPDGGTPLPQAVAKAVDETTSYLNARPALDEGKIILLSDGQSTCGEIRPAGIYSRAQTISVSKIRFITIGFDVPAGSPAERDLQYLATSSGGQYFPAQNQKQLSRAFEKAMRVYVPKNVSGANSDFQNVVTAISRRDYQKAGQIGAEYVKNNPSDPFGFYNLALSLEASGRYKAAAENYRKYLQFAADAQDRREIEARIEKLEQDYIDQFFYYQNLLQSDLDYLKDYYRRLFNRENEKNAAEFAGFVSEKQEFYANLTDILEIRSSRIERDAKDLANSLGVLNRRVGLQSFDRDAVSLLTISIGHLEDVIERLADYRNQNIK